LQRLLSSIAAEVTRRLLDAEAADDFSRQHLANFVWAVATLEHDPGGGRGRGAAFSAEVSGPAATWQRDHRAPLPSLA
jgi:hypothetical protein